MQSSRHTQLLVEALRASSDRISPQPTIKEIHIANSEDRAGVEIVTQLIQLQFLSSPIVQNWTIDRFKLGTLEMKVEKKEVTQLTTGCWIGDDCKTPLLDCLSCIGVEEIKIEKAECKGESSLNRLISLLSIPALQSWTIDQLRITYVHNPWSHLAKAAGHCGQGSIKSLTVGLSTQSLKLWLKENVAAVKISIAFLLFEFGAHCDTDEEVKTLCRVLGFAEEWRVDRLLLADKVGAEGWEALSKVADKGKVETVRNVLSI